MTSNALQFNNFTRIPNHFFTELFPKLREGQLRTFLAIWRHTIGFNRLDAQISLTTLMSDTGCTKRTILLATRALEEMGLILVSKTYSWKGKTYTICDRILQIPNGDFSDSSSGISNNPYKENIKKGKKETIHGRVTKVLEKVRNSSITKEPSVVVSSVEFNKRAIKNNIVKKVIDPTITQQAHNLASESIKKLITGLRKHGVSEPVSKELMTRYSPDEIERQLNWIDSRPCNSNSRAGLLVAAIKQGYKEPSTLKAKGKSEQRLQESMKLETERNESLKQAREATHLLFPSGKHADIIAIQDSGWIEFGFTTVEGKYKKERRPLNVLAVNNVEFVSLETSSVQ